MMGPYVNDPEMGPRWDYVKEGVDAYFACTDCRDFVNDILELKSRSSGLFNSGWDFRERPQVDNLQEVVGDIVDNYEKLKKVKPSTLLYLQLQFSVQERARGTYFKSSMAIYIRRSTLLLVICFRIL